MVETPHVVPPTTIFRFSYISLTECNSGTTRKFPLGVHTTTELNSVTTTSDYIGTLVGSNIPQYLKLLLDAVVTHLSPIIHGC